MLRTFLRAVYCAAIAAPFAWMLLLAVFACAVALQEGHWPSYSNPDPKQTGSLACLGALTLGGFLVTLASPFAALLSLQVASMRGGGPFLPAWHVPLYYAGLLLFGGVVVGDFMGLMTWLMD